MVQLKSIYKAYENIADTIHRTPLFSSEQLSAVCGNRIFFKGEHLQKTGSFKVRGATNKVKHEIENGATYITTASSGNHGQAVAYIANKLKVPATIVVPEDVNQSKMNAIMEYNGGIERFGMTSNERITRAKEIANEKNGIYAPPYDDPFVIAGQGTIGLEILEQLEEVDVIVVPIGGGGLISGILTAIKEKKPSVKVIGVEPETANDTYLSLENGTITPIPKTLTIADGLRTTQPGYRTFPIVQRYVDDIVLVSESDIQNALFFVLERMKQLIEPSSAVAVAAVMFNKIKVKNKNVVCIISGGNVDITKLTDIFPE